jgi:hypothetical protein
MVYATNPTHPIECLSVMRSLEDECHVSSLCRADADETRWHRQVYAVRLFGVNTTHAVEVVLVVFGVIVVFETEDWFEWIEREESCSWFGRWWWHVEEFLCR